VLVLIAANAVPLLGVLGSHWTVFSVILLYWCENVIIGAFNVLRMLCANPRSLATDAGKLAVIPFFIFHYGMFTTVHGIFVLALFGPHTALTGFPGPATFLAAIRAAGIWPAALVIAVSHGFSFVHNYLMSGEYRNAALQRLMAQPYARVIVLHIAILAGGFAAQAMGQPVIALVILIVLKTAIDLKAHLAERKKLGAVPAEPDL
jgi:hypothetical protein